jgi:hypothetical protein
MKFRIRICSLMNTLRYRHSNDLDTTINILTLSLLTLLSGDTSYVTSNEITQVNGGRAAPGETNDAELKIKSILNIYPGIDRFRFLKALATYDIKMLADTKTIAISSSSIPKQNLIFGIWNIHVEEHDVLRPAPFAQLQVIALQEFDDEELADQAAHVRGTCTGRVRNGDSPSMTT